MSLFPLYIKLLASYQMKKTYVMQSNKAVQCLVYHLHAEVKL
jgi:hypothetical protein